MVALSRPAAVPVPKRTAKCVSAHGVVASRRQLGASLLAAALASPALSATASAGTGTTAVIGASTPSSVGAGSAAAEFWSGLIAGFVQKTVKAIALHPLDTAKTRLQVGSRREVLTVPELFTQPYAGLLPTLVSGSPAAALFFAVKDGIKQQTLAQLGPTGSTLVGVAGANVAYWGVKNPAELIKSRRQSGKLESSLEGAKVLWREQGPAGLYIGFGANYAYAYPVDAAKFLLYESVKSEFARRNGGTKLSTLEAAIAGALSAASAQSVATPLDVARTRIMTGEAAADSNSVSLIRQIASEEGVAALFAGLSPKVVRALLSGAIQFSSYEFTKDAVGGVVYAALGVERTQPRMQ